MQILLGQRLTVWTKSGPIPAVVSRKAPHLLTDEERNKVPRVHRHLGRHRRQGPRARSRRWSRPATRSRSSCACRELRNGLVTSPGLDDKVGVWTVMETLRLLHGKPLQAAVFCVSTVQEEIGLRGATTSAYGIHPTVGIAVDVCHATDTPGNDKKQLGDTRLGNGPVALPRPEHQPARPRPPRRRRPRRSEIAGAGPRRPQGDRHRRQRHPAQPRRRRRRAWSASPIATCTARWRWSASRIWTTRPACWRSSAPR